MMMTTTAMRKTRPAAAEPMMRGSFSWMLVLYSSVGTHTHKSKSYHFLTKPSSVSLYLMQPEASSASIEAQESCSVCLHRWETLTSPLSQWGIWDRKHCARYLQADGAVHLDSLAPVAYGQALEEMCWVVCVGARQTDWDVGKAWGTFFSLSFLPSFLVLL